MKRHPIHWPKMKLRGARTRYRVWFGWAGRVQISTYSTQTASYQGHGLVRSRRQAERIEKRYQERGYDTKITEESG